MNTDNATSTVRRVLIVDDNQDAASTLSLLLKFKGFDAQTCYDGTTALSLCETLRPDVIVMDLAMPVLDGFDTARLIRQQPWGRNLFLIALSGYGMEEDRQRSREAGFDAHLVKPVNLPALIDLFSQPIGRRQ